MGTQGTIGVVAGPEQIADGTNPQQLATVDANGDVFVKLDQIDRRFLSSRGGDFVISSAATLDQILVELRVITNLLMIGLNVQEDPEALRNDQNAALGATSPLSS